MNDPAKPVFHCDDRVLERRFGEACHGLESKLVEVGPEGNRSKVLIEGGGYPGIWLECGPMEGVIYGTHFRPEVALWNHWVFFRHQRRDGQFPCWISRDRPGFSQIQMVEPIARSAWDTYQLTGDSGFLLEAYLACTRFDAWLAANRDRNRTGLVELFCEYDTGHDRSSRFHDFCPELPRACPEGEAINCPQIEGLPWLAPDLSASLFGGRQALALMAGALDRPADAEKWRQRAEATRRAILSRLFDPDTLCFYDRDSMGKWNRIASDALLRVLAENVVDEQLFNRIFDRWVSDPEAFFSPFPFPSVALNDPHFVHALPANCWGGPSQALTALRAPRWMRSHGRLREMDELMRRWLLALTRADFFFQQMNPRTGAPIRNDWVGESRAESDYTPSMLVMVDFTARSFGVRETATGVEWACGSRGGTHRSRYEAARPNACLEITDASSTLVLDGRRIASVNGRALIETTKTGRLSAVTNLGHQRQVVEIHAHLPDGLHRISMQLDINETNRL